MDFYLITFKLYFFVKHHITKGEINELKSFRPKPVIKIPQDFQDYLNSYDGLEAAEEIRKYAFSQYYSKDQYNKKWAQQSIISAVDLFLDKSILNLNDYSEGDISFNVWSFVYTLFKDKFITAKLGKKSSISVSLARNSGRNLELTERRFRKITGAKVDILFKYGQEELGCCEIGRDNVTEVDDKYLNDGCMKLPKTLRDMFSNLVRKNPEQINSFVTVGYLMMGISLELVLMDVPVGNLICRILRTEKYEFPQSVDTFSLDFIPLLEAAWHGKEIMKSTIAKLKNRKRKVVGPLNDNNAESSSLSFPCSFYLKRTTSSASTTTKDNDANNDFTADLC